MVKPAGGLAGEGGGKWAGGQVGKWESEGGRKRESEKAGLFLFLF